MSDHPDQHPRHVDVAVLGAGSAGETLVAGLSGSGLDVVVFEPHRVGGECPFVACMPSKAMLHDAAVGRSWHDAVRRRSDVVENLDDDVHAAEIEANGATLVRSAAHLTGPGRLTDGEHDYAADHVVIATGASVQFPPIDGLDELGDRCWTSDDAMLTEERPARLTIIGGGVIGCEMATLFGRFGTEVHLLDAAPLAFADLPRPIGEIVDDSLSANGVRVRRGVDIEHVEVRGAGVRIRLASGASVDTDRVLVATGVRPNTRDLGLECLGIDPEEQLPIDPNGRLRAEGSVWAIGDVAGLGAYTHLANHQARVVAAELTGHGPRRFDEVTTPACVFTDPPIVTIGPVPSALGDDVVWAEARITEIPRSTTDQLTNGYLTIAVTRDSGVIVAAHGAGAGFDILAAALVTAIDAQLPVARLARSMYPFPTVGELLGLVYSRAAASLSAT
jgi:pyruvate/2-oxoglutarate dehydrogenase complex dihydrolipoamide dehydrogenase (E3) component